MKCVFSEATSMEPRLNATSELKLLTGRPEVTNLCYIVSKFTCLKLRPLWTRPWTFLFMYSTVQYFVDLFRKSFTESN